MKYFRSELLGNEVEWRKISNEYSEMFEKIKGIFPRDFLEIYLSEYGFHDRKICKIVMSDDATVIVELKGNNGIFIRIIYSGVTDFNFHNINKICKERQIGCLLEWAYDEFSQSGEKLTHSVLTSCGLEFRLVFEGISAIFTNELFEASGTVLYI